MSRASAPLPLSPSALVTFKEALGCSVIGTILSTACVYSTISAVSVAILRAAPGCSVYGITVLQAYNYLRHSSHDSVRTRWFVSGPLASRTTQLHTLVRTGRIGVVSSQSFHSSVLLTTGCSGLDTVTMILTLYGFYGDFVTNYGDASAFLSIPP